MCKEFREVRGNGSGEKIQGKVQHEEFKELTLGPGKGLEFFDADWNETVASGWRF